ncbi:hypothetical protein LXL04_037173 [Taraxacum kok-saghyz]
MLTVFSVILLQSFLNAIYTCPRKNVCTVVVVVVVVAAKVVVVYVTTNLEHFVDIASTEHLMNTCELVREKEDSKEREKNIESERSGKQRHQIGEESTTIDVVAPVNLQTQETTRKRLENEGQILKWQIEGKGNEIQGLVHVDCLLKMAVKKSILHVKLMNRPVSRDSQAKNGPYCDRFDNRTKILITINALLLTATDLAKPVHDTSGQGKRGGVEVKAMNRFDNSTFRPSVHLMNRRRGRWGGGGDGGVDGGGEVGGEGVGGRSSGMKEGE